MKRPLLLKTIPKEILLEIETLTAIEAGFGAGPSCITGGITKFDPPADLKTALKWVEHRRDYLKAAHVMLCDHTVLWFDPIGYKRYDREPCDNPPRPGASVAVSPPRKK